MSGIEVRNITKFYGSTCALNNVSLKFEEGKIYGLLGRNGAGKSTLLNIITGKVFPDRGNVYSDGNRILENDSELGKIYMTSENNLYPEGMKVKNAFKWTKNFYPDFDESYASEISKRFDLNINKSVKSLSTGYNSIFKLVVALSVNAPYIFFDEPVLGLDANNRDLFYKLLIEKYSSRPFTVVISTHLIEEVSTIVEDVIIIKNGNIIKSESCEMLLSQGYTVSGSAKAVDDFIVNKNVIGTDSLGAFKSAHILGELENEIPDGLEVAKLDLQKLFIQLTNS